MQNPINDYRARKEERKRRYMEARDLAFEEKQGKHEESREWLREKEHKVRKIGRWHMVAVLAPVALLLIFDPNSYEVPAYSVYLLAAIWTYIVRWHYLGDWDYQSYQEALKWYKKKYGPYQS